MNSLRVLVVALLSLFASIAQAKDLEHDLHFSLDAGLVSWQKLKLDVPIAGEIVDKTVQVGLPNNLGAHVGFLPFDVLEAGLRFSLSFTKHDRDGDKSTSSTNEVLAYARYVMPGGSLRPFVGPVIGATFFRDTDPGENRNVSVSVSGAAFTVGGELGLYGFLLDGLSLDPVLAFTYAHGNTRTGAAIPNLFGTASDYDTTSYQVTFGLSLSGWVGL